MLSLYDMLDDFVNQISLSGVVGETNYILYFECLSGVGSSKNKRRLLR